MMAVGLMYEAKGVTKEQYESVLAEVTPNRVAPPGMLFHSAGPMTGGGWRVSETWESQEALDTFVQNTLRQALEHAGITDQPQTFEVESIIQQAPAQAPAV
jgi:quinol monooxygenase YgiN